MQGFPKFYYFQRLMSLIFASSIKPMRKISNRYFPLIAALAVVGFSIFWNSCANTTEAPTGGPRDTIPPVLVKVSPKAGTVHVPVHDAKVVFTFDEYVVVKDNKGIYLSPPQQKNPKFKIKGKSVVVYFEEDLAPNTTYTLDITNALADNNESNLFPGFTAVFSTGGVIDSMFVTGIVQDCNNLKPIKGATVMMYKDQRDSAVFLERPYASAKTDDWGYFAIRNIQDTVYRMYAIVDANANNLYDPDEDRIAFVDGMVRPRRVVNDTLPELTKFEMKDTVHCLAREKDFELNVFRERPSKQYLNNKARLADRFCYVTFMAPDARIDSLWFQGFPASRVITEFNVRKDSLLLWLNDQRAMPDSLHLWVKYWKTDSLGVLRPETEKVSLVDEKKPKTKPVRKQIEHKDTVCAIALKAAPETVEQDGFALEFTYPPVLADFKALEFKSINPKQKEQAEKFKIERDPQNLRKYIITPQVTLMPGYEYSFKVPQRVFKDINNHWNDSTQLKVALPASEELSTLELHLTGVETNYIVDLLNEGKNSVLRTCKIRENASLLFKYLKEAGYYIRVTRDENGNGVVDTGSLLEHRQPEKALFLKIDDKDLIQIPARTELSQDFDLGEVFK